MFGNKPMPKWIKTDHLGICNGKLMNVSDGLLGLAVVSIIGAIAIRSQAQEWEPAIEVANDDGSYTVSGVYSTKHFGESI